MDLHGFADVRTFRVRLPKPVYPSQGRESIQACVCVDGLESDWLEISQLVEFSPSKFSDRNPLNIPGPVYGAETDTCGTGPQEAPDNVLLDKNGQEFVFKQATYADEFGDLVSAAICECFMGYGSDGDAHWKLSTIRDWWQTRADMLSEGIGEVWCKPKSVEQWKRALKGDATGYLRVYAFFVEHGRVPVDGDMLPDIG